MKIENKTTATMIVITNNKTTATMTVITNNKTTATMTVITFQQQHNGYNDCNHITTTTQRLQ